MNIRKMQLLTIFMVANTAASIRIASSQSVLIPQIASREDSHLKFPSAHGEMGRRDAEGIRVLTSYLNKVAPDPKSDICISGELAVGNGSHFRATLSMGSGGATRLDFQAPNGTRSVRMDGAQGGVVQENGEIIRYPVTTSMAGVIPSPGMLRKAVADKRTTIIDDGLVSVGTVRYRSITLVRQVYGIRRQAAVAPPMTLQLLFDPANDLVTKAVDSVVLSQTSRTQHLRVVTFGGYEKQGESTIPSRITETRDGQLSWELTGTVEKECVRAPEYFRLER